MPQRYPSQHLPLLLALCLPASAGAVPFTAGLPVERFEVSGGATFSDEFDDDVFPGTTWGMFCGAASEAGGELSIEASGTSMFCPSEPFFAAGPLLPGFTTDTTVTADFNLPLPAEGEFLGIQVSNPLVNDFVNVTLAQVGGTFFATASADEGATLPLPIDPADLPVGFYTLQIALEADTNGDLLPTVGGSTDGNPLFTVPLPGFKLESPVRPGIQQPPDRGHGSRAVAGRASPAGCARRAGVPHPPLRHGGGGVARSPLDIRLPGSECRTRAGPVAQAPRGA